MNLKEKIIVVTGAASGIGRALAIRFNQEGAKKIIAVDMNIEGAQETANLVNGEAMHADVSKEVDIKNVINKLGNRNCKKLSKNNTRRHLFALFEARPPRCPKIR